MTHNFFTSLDIEQGVHPERVTLAWQRTLISLITVVAVIMRYGISESAVPAIVWVGGAIALGLIAIATFLNRRRYRDLRNHMHRQAFPPSPSPQMFAISVALVVVGLLCLTLAVSGLVRSIASV